MNRPNYSFYFQNMGIISDIKQRHLDETMEDTERQGHRNPPVNLRFKIC